MNQNPKVALRRALFISGLKQGLDAAALHEFIEDGLRLAELAEFIESKQRDLKAAG